MLPLFLHVFFLVVAAPGPPAGTIQVKNYFIDKTEILNIHWEEYVRLKSRDLTKEEIDLLLPSASNNAYALPENKFKPVVLITYDQAVAYCKWRSEVVSKRFNRKITYRLPTPEEWQEIAQELLASDARQAQKELKDTQKLMSKTDGAYTLLENDEPKDKLYHLLDNVSEMTSRKGVAMGLNNYDLYKLTNDVSPTPETLLKANKYTEPHSYLGFRCVAEVSKSF